jgi:hypothetical protein
MKKPKPFTALELDMIASFLEWQREEFILHCDGFDQYSDEEVDEIIRKVSSHFFYLLKTGEKYA